MAESLEKRTLLSAGGAAQLAPGLARVAWEGQEAVAKAGEWIVRVNGAADAADSPKGLQRANAMLRGARPDVSAVAALDDQGTLLVRAPADLSYGRLRQSLRGVAGFQFLEPNITYSLTGTFPDDPGFVQDQQWALNNVGQNGGVIDADIDAPEAWDRTTGDGSAVVAILDTGVDYTHADLNDNIWANSGEIGLDALGRDKRTNGLDDDRNGYADDFRGWDFSGIGDNNPTDINGHGTHVAGIAAAEGNNGIGISGIAWDAQIMPIRMFDDSNLSTLSSTLAAINYVTKMRRDYGVNVRVMNASWGGPSYSQSLYDSIAAAGRSGILFVAASGNGGSDYIGDNNDTTPFYPSSYNLPNLIAVAGSNSSDALTGHSNYGVSSVDLAAPGGSILSTYPGNFDNPNGRYAYLTGTSMAAPHVAGAAALAFGAVPEATYQQVRDGIFNGVDLIAAFSGKVATGGRLNVDGMLTELLGPRPVTDTTAPTANLIDVTPDPRETAVNSIDIEFSEPVSGFDFSDLLLTRDGSANLLTASQTLTAGADAQTYTLDGLSSLTATPGTYTLSLIAAGSDIRDGASNLLAVNASDTWTVVVAPTIVSWSSAASHDSGVGEVGLTMPDDNLFVESRSAGVSKLLVRFDRPVDPATFTPASVQLAGNGQTGALNLSGITISTSLLESNTLGVVTFSEALPNYAKYLVRLSGVAGPGGVALSGDADRVFTALIGDVTGDARVNATDLSRVRGASTGLVDPAITSQVRADVSVDGRVNATDLSRVQFRNGDDARGIATPTVSQSTASLTSSSTRFSQQTVRLVSNAAAGSARPARASDLLLIDDEVLVG